jgi:ClpP class serine protease
MANWNAVLNEITALIAHQPDALDVVRRKYLAQLHQYTGRNIIAYYSGWLQKPNIQQTAINDDDKNGLMAVIHGLDRTKGLDLILHTPGGDIAAAESTVNYLRKMFGTDIRAFIPQIAMSAGTMIACACKVLVMGKQSNIGPFDPQFNGIPAYGVIEEFESALEAIKKDPQTTPIWQTVVSKYHPTFLGECDKAIKLAGQIVHEWLVTGMFNGLHDAEQQAGEVVRRLNNHSDTMTHARHIHVEEAKAIGLTVVDLESDDQLQDLTLTVHHAFMHTLANSSAIKIIENHAGAAVMNHIPPQR